VLLERKQVPRIAVAGGRATEHGLGQGALREPRGSEEKTLARVSPPPGIVSASRGAFESPNPILPHRKQTNGVALSKTTLDLDVPGLNQALLQASGVFLVGLTELAASTDLEWNLALISGADRAHENAAFDIASNPFNSAAVGGVRSPDYVTLTNFLLESRAQLWWRNPTGITGEKRARITAVLGVIRRSS
jgi:hypothetical protein